MTVQTHNKSFPLGTIVSTPGVLDAVPHPQMLNCLARHARGDWGHVCAEDAAQNDRAVEGTSRIVSAYPINPDLPCKGYGDNCFWIITESDRSVTTFLLPSEY